MEYYLYNKFGHKMEQMPHVLLAHILIMYIEICVCPSVLLSYSIISIIYRTLCRNLSILGAVWGLDIVYLFVHRLKLIKIFCARGSAQNRTNVHVHIDRWAYIIEMFFAWAKNKCKFDELKKRALAEMNRTAVHI